MTVTLSWNQPSPLNAVAGSSVTYKFEVRKADGTDTWVDMVDNLSSVSTSLTKDFTMANLKTKASYVTGNKGNAIKVRITATNVVGTASTASEANADSAIYQEAPAVYDGTTKITVNSVTTTTATLSWLDVTAPADYGYSEITGWKYWYNSTSGTYIEGTTAVSTRTVTLSTPALTAGTTYSFYIEPLNLYQIATDLTAPRAGTTALTFKTSDLPSPPTDVKAS